MALIREILPPQEGSVYTSDSVQLKIGDKLLNSGNLYITEEYLSWKPSDNNIGISVLWKQISLHGISNNPSKSVYVMLDHAVVWEGVYDPGANLNGNQAMDENADSDNDEGHESDWEQNMTELWLIPSDANTVDLIFQAMKQCQALHPDSADSISDESDFMDADQEEPLDLDEEVGQGDMRNLNLNEDRFADAEED